MSEQINVIKKQILDVQDRVGMEDINGQDLKLLVADHARILSENAALKEQVQEFREALTSIACFEDAGANHFLERTGNYCQFDEPCSVEAARAALAKHAVTQEGE